jgi:hypothetical protein
MSHLVDGLVTREAVAEQRCAGDAFWLRGLSMGAALAA